MTIDDRARAAAHALRDDVAGSTDTEAALAQVLLTRSRGPRRRLPLLAAAAALVAVFAVSTAVVSSGDDDTDDDVSIDADPDPDAEEGTPLQLLAPDDGRQSIQLPVTVEPATGLVEGQTVQVAASGFEPGESVGVVQCTAEAREPVYAGVDACRTSPFAQLTADADGNVTGQFTVTRSLTVPFSGTVDCASATGACLIGVGALSNYDRSGGMDLAFADTGDAVERPAVEVSQTTDLTDGQSVHVIGSGFTDAGAGVSVCATSPAVCWMTGDPSSASGGGDTDVTTSDGTIVVSRLDSLPVAADGSIDSEVRVWRFLPGMDPGTYVDCAVSVCSLRFAGELAPPPVPLAFAGSEAPPAAPVVEVTPADGLRAGDEVRISGSGFGGGTLLLSFCATQPAAEASPGPGLGSRPSSYCVPLESDDDGDGDVVELDGGAFAVELELGSFESTIECLPTGGGEGCPPVVTEGWTYEIQLHPWGGDGGAGLPPSFGAPPVRIGFTP
jgi:hypothetical protein